MPRLQVIPTPPSTATVHELNVDAEHIREAAHRLRAFAGRFPVGGRRWVTLMAMASTMEMPDTEDRVGQARALLGRETPPADAA